MLRLGTFQDGSRKLLTLRDARGSKHHKDGMDWYLLKVLVSSCKSYPFIARSIRQWIMKKLLMLYTFWYLWKNSLWCMHPILSYQVAIWPETDLADLSWGAMVGMVAWGLGLGAPSSTCWLWWWTILDLGCLWPRLLVIYHKGTRNVPSWTDLILP